MTNTKLSEDFVLFSEQLKLPVYIQCKSSGGGRRQHGKNIQNRAKEQIARSILYRARLIDGAITWQPKAYHLIWNTGRELGCHRAFTIQIYPYVTTAGYDKWFAASSLLTSEGQGMFPNPLEEYLIDVLKCRRI